MRRFFIVCLLVAACGDDGHQTKADAGVDSGSGVDAPPMQTEITCEQLAPIASGTCEVTAGGSAKLVKGTVLTPSTVYIGGQVAVDATGRISCVGCNCAQGGETTIVCPDGVISPGLINTHDHITFTQNQPYTDTGERYEHRHQWRRGQDGHTQIPSAGSASADQIRWGELRFLMGGATSIVGSGGQAGILRNLDIASQMEGLQKKAVDFDTFPLDDAGGARRTGDCNYGGMPTTSASLANLDAYEPHTAEGIDRSARNEFLCESSTTYDATAPGVSDNLVVSKTSMIHAIGLTPADYGAMATAGTGLIWSPRSNITLYGDTARVSTAARLGVNIALGTDWMPTGSMNLLRELQCADTFNATYLDHYFSDAALWKMVTANAAAVTKMDDQIGVLATGRLADITIFAAHGKTFRAVIDAKPEDVALVMRAGKVLYGDDTAVDSLATSCDVVDVCGTSKRVCLMAEVGKTYSALKSGAGANIYPAFTCGAPMNEPSCTPKRPTAVAGSTVYTGAPSSTDSDGDGIPNSADKCPTTFDPVRPVDNGTQGDADDDGVGDVCDVCPLDANTTTCTVVDPNDRDHDGAPNTTDNCPDIANSNQADDDNDGKGNVCDPCPNAANPGAAGCPVTIYAIKMGTVAVGSSVRVEHALVTGRGSNGFFVQVKDGDVGYMGADYSGLFVFTGAGTTTLANASVGARVTIDGAVDSFVGELELSGVSAVTVEAVGPEAAPTPVAATYAEVATGGSRAAQLEGVLVTLGPAQVTAQNMMFGEFTLTSGMTNLIVDDFLYAEPTTLGKSYTSATGILGLKPNGGGTNASKLHPRSAADFVAAAPALASFGPAMSYAREGVAGTFPQTLTVTLNGPAQGDTSIMVMSNDPALTVGAVVVPDQMLSAVVPVTGVTQNADVTLTAVYGMQMLTAHVRVLGAMEQPTTLTLSPMDSTVPVGGMQAMTATFDLPVPSDTTVALTATQGMAPATVTVLANQVAASFMYVDTAGSGTATITATFGGLMSSATVTTMPMMGGVDHLIINEVDYDQIGTDNKEYIEIYNPTAAAISLANKSVVLVNGSNNTTYSTIDLSSVGSLDPGQYLVIAGPMVTVTAPAIKLDPSWTMDKIQNGAPDGIALIDTQTMTLIDALSYEGAMTMAMVTGVGTVSLVEGTALAATVADSNTADGSLCRSPNGADANNANVDWVFCMTLSPGTANP